MKKIITSVLFAAVVFAPVVFGAAPKKPAKPATDESAGATPASAGAVVVMKIREGNPYGGIRIPAIVAGKNGRLLAFAEGRANGSDQANNKIILSLSDDDGRTWSKADCIANPGKDCYNNPCPVFDATTGSIFVIFQKYPAGVSEQNGKLTANGPASLTNWVIESKDNGRTWSKPKDITATTKSDKVRLLASGPHNGVQLTRGVNKGRLVIPFNEAPKFGDWSVYAVFSDDHGRTWKRGEAAGNKGGVPNETSVAELESGAVMINARKWTGANRKVAVSKNGGESFGDSESDPALVCDGTQGALLRYSFADEAKAGGKSRLVYAGPGGPGRRTNGTVYVSYNDGREWAAKKVVIPGKFAYSGLVRLADGDIGILYEPAGHEEIRFARVSLGWLTDGADKGK